MPDLALSTCWNSHRHTDGHDMLREIADMGFTSAELSHGIRITLVPGVIRAVEEGVIKIASTHNFCPLPTGVLHAAPNYFEPSALRAAGHEQWIRHTTRSIEFAAQMGAGLTVLHLGSVRFLWRDPENALDAFAAAFKEAGNEGRLADDPAWKKLLAKSLARLRKAAPRFYERMVKSLEAVIPLAVEKNLKLGLENREGFDELPLDDTFGALLDKLPEPHTCGFWHDAGHACLKERLGLLNHREFLEKTSPRLHGFHLHDVSADGRDHQPVGDGVIDWGMLSGFWRPNHLLTLELSPKTKAEDVLRSRERVGELMRSRGLA
ncbi:MAG: sugar phosphate isomerase/epimerase [Opitutaceae bacterium]|nr:sugar phosphate isomerase/epimerase [Opitutaceae bacterium]